jgi:hypothetical protein
MTFIGPKISKSTSRKEISEKLTKTRFAITD